jgi:hypothetical protein
MGTSKSNPGANDKSPLIPPWADDGGPPPPQAVPLRFRSFRTALGRAARTGSQADVTSALGHYARQSSGGGTTASRRYSAIARDGANLINALTQLRGVGASGTGDAGSISVAGRPLPDLRGMPCDVAIDILVTVLSEGHGDSEKVRAAMEEALSVALEGQETFNPGSISDDLLVGVLLNYLSDCVFLDIVANGGDALSKAPDGRAAMDFENSLRETVGSAVDAALHAALGAQNSIGTLSAKALVDIQQQAIKGVWDAWAGDES